jgi:hypothetical protein
MRETSGYYGVLVTVWVMWKASRRVGSEVGFGFLVGSGILVTGPTTGFGCGGLVGFFGSFAFGLSLGFSIVFFFPLWFRVCVELRS